MNEQQRSRTHAQSATRRVRKLMSPVKPMTALPSCEFMGGRRSRQLRLPAYRPSVRLCDCAAGDAARFGPGRDRSAAGGGRGVFRRSAGVRPPRSIALDRQIGGGDRSDGRRATGESGRLRSRDQDFSLDSSHSGSVTNRPIPWEHVMPSLAILDTYKLRPTYLPRALV